jgi:putative DNA primase/helicase
MSAEAAKKWPETEQIPVAPHAGRGYPENDSDRAVRFAERFGADLRYVSCWKSWLQWDGTRWVRDADGAVMRKAQEMSHLLLDEAAQIGNFNERKRAANLALKAGDVQKLKAMIELAGAQPGIAADPEMFDSVPYLLGVRNGVVDLRTGEFRQARKEDYLTMQAGTEYNAEATCPQWEAFLRDIFNGDDSLISFVQCAVGYSLTGFTYEQVLFFLYGTGRNGKSTKTETLQALLGDYAQHAPAALFVSNRNGNEPEKEIARLKGVRFVVGSEIEEGSKLAESRVKDLTGQDTLTGRFLYGSPFDFKPTHKLWIFGNHKPDVSGTDLGIWRRMRLVPFEVQIPEAKIDPQLPTKLLTELPGILNWAIKGCLRWKKEGLVVPQRVKIATAEYQDEEDELGEFIQERCVLGPNEKIERPVLHRSYLDWIGPRVARMGAKTFNKRMRAREGIKEFKSSDRFWHGIGLKPDPDETPVCQSPARPAPIARTSSPAGTAPSRAVGQKNGSFPQTSLVTQK